MTQTAWPLEQLQDAAEVKDSYQWCILFKKYKTQPLQTTWEIVEYDAKNPEIDNFQASFKFMDSWTAIKEKYQNSQRIYK